MNSCFSLKKAFDGFVVSCQARRLSPHTIADYSNIIRKLSIYIGNISISEIDKKTLREFLALQK